MAGIVIFNYAGWRDRYPEFTAIPQATVQQYFNEAGLYWKNDGTSPVKLDAQQVILLNMLTAHIAALNSQGSGSQNPGAPQDPNSLVGRVSTAIQGSVSVGTELSLSPTASSYKAWLEQTRYGLAFLSAIGPYILGFYIPGNLQPGGVNTGPYPYPKSVGPW